MSPTDKAQDILNRMRRAHERGMGVKLSAADLQDLYLTRFGELWSQPDPREQPRTHKAMTFTRRAARYRLQQIVASLETPATRAQLEARLHMARNTAQPYLRHLLAEQPPRITVTGSIGSKPIYGVFHDPERLS